MNVLSAVAGGIDKPTRIMYKVGLSWKPNQDILSSLIEKGMIKLKEGKTSARSRKLYEITDRGNSIIRYFEEGKEFMGLLQI